MTVTIKIGMLLSLHPRIMFLACLLNQLILDLGLLDAYFEQWGTFQSVELTPFSISPYLVKFAIFN